MRSRMDSATRIRNFEGCDERGHVSGQPNGRMRASLSDRTHGIRVQQQIDDPQ